MRRLPSAISDGRLPSQAGIYEGSACAQWVAHPHVFQIDIMPDGTLEWFYRNRDVPGDYDGAEDFTLDSIPPEALRHCAMTKPAS